MSSYLYLLSLSAGGCGQIIVGYFIISLDLIIIMASRLVPKIAPNFLTGVWGPACKGSLGMIFAPGRFKIKEPEIIRSLEQDLLVLKNQYHTQTLVSLIEQKQYANLRITEKPSLCEKLGIKHLSFPIVDYCAPQNLEPFKSFVRRIVDEEIRQDKTVVAHCKAGLGRTGLFASSCLVYAGMPAEEAIKLVRKTRPGTLETGQQLDYVKSLKF